MPCSARPSPAPPARPTASKLAPMPLIPLPVFPRVRDGRRGVNGARRSQPNGNGTRVAVSDSVGCRLSCSPLRPENSLARLGDGTGGICANISAVGCTGGAVPRLRDREPSLRGSRPIRPMTSLCTRHDVQTPIIGDGPDAQASRPRRRTAASRDACACAPPPNAPKPLKLARMGAGGEAARLSTRTPPRPPRWPPR